MPAGKDPQTLKAVNENGNFTFDSSASINMNGSTTKIYNTGLFEIESGAQSDIRITSGNANVSVNTDHLNLISSKTGSNLSVFITADGLGGGIKLDSGYGGITQYSTGNIDINALNSDINIGVFPSGTNSDTTNNIIMESANNITADATDMIVTMSDSIQFISLTGDIRMGTSSSSAIIRFEDENLLINQTSSTLDTQLDILVSDQSSDRPGYNGIIVNSSNTTVGADITLQTSDSNASISMGVEPQSSKYSYFKEYIASQSGTTIIPAYGPEFTSADIGRRVYWTTTDATDTIASLGTTITASDDSYAILSLTTSGSYTGSDSRIYRIEIDSVGSNDTFRWSRDCGKTYVETYRTTSVGAITLEDGIQIAFSAITASNLGDYWTFHTKITAIVGANITIANSEKLQMLQEFSAYIRTSNISDIQVKTAGNERMRITADGSIGIGQHIPTSTLEITNQIGVSQLVNEYDTNYQINPTIASLKYGGYVVAWESKLQDGDDYGIYVHQMTADGAKFGSQSKVNITISGQQSNPHVAGRNTTNSRDFAVVWASEESDGSGVYDIYANLYVNGSRLKSSDVLVNSANTANQQIHPRIVGLTDGTYLIVWSSDDSNTGDYNIYGRIMNNSGILVGSRFQVSSTSDSYSVLHPYPFSISDSDDTIPGGYGVVFMNEYNSQDTAGTGINDDDRYNIQYRLFNSSGTAQISDTDITDSTGNRLTLSDGLVSAIGMQSGGFALSFYRNYEGKASLYNVADGVVGETSGVSGGTISAASGQVITITGLTATDRFLVGEIITIANFWEEKIDKVSHNGSGTATITLSKGHKQVSLYKYATSSTTPTVSDLAVNTSVIVEDTERTNSSILPDIMRASSIFTYRRPFASIAELHNGNFIVAWTSGRKPSIYYQIIDNLTSSKISGEKQISEKYSALKQRNLMIASNKTMEGQDAGVAVVWDVETMDTGLTGIYQTVINPNVPIFKISNQETNFSVSQDGNLGIGVNIADDRIHIQSSENTSNIIIQNSSSNVQSIRTDYSTTNILFKDQDKITGIIRAGHSLNYQKLHPNYDNLVAYYPFDDAIGSNALSDLSQNKSDARIENFDVYTDWNTSNGIINGCLTFNGSINYIDTGIVATLHNLSTSSDGYTINSWIKLPNYITTSANLDIVSNGGNLSTEGTYLLSVRDLGSNGTAYLSSSLTTSSGLQTSNGLGSGIGLGNWHMITNIYHSSNGSLENYVDGTFNSSSIAAGTVSTAPTANVYIGSRDTTSGFFRGSMDELRVYNKAFTREEISGLYGYGNETKGRLTFTTQGGLNNWADNTHGFTIDDTGKMQGVQVKSHSFARLAGTTTTYSGSSVIDGSSTTYDKDLQMGDTINVGGTELVITKIRSETLLDVDRATANTNTTKLIRKPSILSFHDIDDNLKGLIDYSGNMLLGSGKPASMLEIIGTGGSTDLPYITLTNATEADTEGGRNTKIQFRGVNGGTKHTLGIIEGSHSSTGDDTKGKMRFLVNNGSSAVESIRIKHDSNVGIGNVDPIGILHVKDPQNCEFVLESGGDEELVFGTPSSIFFAGSNASTDSNGLSGSFAKIQGSSDNNSINVSGRLDFYTNDNVQNEGLQNRLSILSDGKVGLGIIKPFTQCQITKEATLVSDTTAELSGTTITLNNAYNGNVINGVAVFGDVQQTIRKITAQPTSTTLTVSESGTVASGTSINLYPAGLCVDSNSNVSVGNVSSLTKFHVEGAISTAITSKSGDYTTTLSDSTILGDATTGEFIITLVNAVGYNGIHQTIVKTDSSASNVRVSGGSSTINGSAFIDLISQYKFLNVVSYSDNWYITSSNI